jgi:hypothetical protein
MLKVLEFSTVRIRSLFLLVTCTLVLHANIAYTTIGTTVPISAELGTSIAGDLFPVTLKLTQGNLFLSEPVLLYQDNRRIGMQVRFQAYDHRPAQGVAVSEMGRAIFSGSLGYDAQTRQVLLHNPRMDKLSFDRKNDATLRFLTELNAAWSAQVTNPIRAELPPHPYLVPFKNNIQNLSYDGKNIILTISYE